jgi:single-stranded DNA-binding protein
MTPISITVTGRLGDDPRTFTTRDGTDGVELRLALDLPPRGSGDGITRWVKVTAFGLLATRTADSVHKGDRVTVVADDLTAEAWLATASSNDRPEPRARVTLRAGEIAASMAFDTLRTGYADRKASRQAAANGEPNGLPAAEQAEARVLRGVTAS